MPRSVSSPVREEIRAVFDEHRSWLDSMPWGANWEDSIEAAICGWIDEYSGEFSGEDVRLSSSLDLPRCFQRVLNLISGPCIAYVSNTEKVNAIYSKVFRLLSMHDESPPHSAGEGISAVRRLYETFGINDGIRHCILASAVEAGHDRAYRKFAEELDGVRRQLASAFAGQIGESDIDVMWQELLADMAFSKSTES